jgi:maltooligosyltrehalose trehalohydrolase
MMMRPTLGAWPEADGFRFRVWAPDHSDVALVIESGQYRDHVTLAPAGDGTFSGHVPGVSAGTRYGYLLDHEGPFPDPASRSQPDGVHALSALVDPQQFLWTDTAWSGVTLADAVIYELHVGTFTPEGTFAGVAARLPYLADLGVTVIELMPIAEFPGTRNWGYDGASLFAPAHVYGAPDDLRRLVDGAHALGLAVILDVVYNHFGPDGAYGFRFSPWYASATHTSPWGAAVNFDGEASAHVRTFVIENALQWLHDYHLDGLRLDATHAIVDTGPQHIVAELAERARAEIPDRSLLLIAEDDRNLRTIVEPVARGGWGLDAVWADDFHHQVRRAVAGDHEAYFGDFSGDTRDLAETIEQGWFYSGQMSAFRHAPRGTESAQIPRARMVICLQNHDQVGNRAFGDRLHHAIDARVYRVLSALLLFAPETPLLFMGQEWGTSSPFRFFTDHNPELGRLVTNGRRAEFAHFSAFRDEAVRDQIPDPQALATFEASRLDWSEAATPDHAATLRFYRALLRLRRDEPAMQGADRAEGSARCRVTAPDADTLTVTRTAPSGETLLLVVRLRGAGPVALPAAPGDRGWSIVLTSEDDIFRVSTDTASAPPPPPSPPALAADSRSAQLAVPSAMLLRAS